MGNSIKIFFYLAGTVALIFGAWLKWNFTPKGDPASEGSSVAASTGVTIPDNGGKEILSEQLASSLPQPRRELRRGKLDDRFKKQFEMVGRLLQNHQPEEAMKILQGVLAEDPNSERALEEMGMIYMTEYQNTDKAVEYFQKVVSMNPDNEFAIMELVGISAIPGKSAGALEYLRTLYDNNPNSSALADGIGELLMSHGRLSEAIPYLEKSAEDPRYSEFAYSRMASVYQQNGDMERAVESYRKAIDFQNEQIKQKQQLGEPTEMYELDMARSQLDIARMLLSERKYEEAEDYLEKARSRLGSDWEVETLFDDLRRMEDSGR